jgi:hypothetical protein
MGRLLYLEKIWSAWWGEGALSQLTNTFLADSVTEHQAF